MTQGAVADAVGVHKATVTAWEIGKQRPEGENLRALAQFYGTTEELILEGPPEEPTTRANAVVYVLEHRATGARLDAEARVALAYAIALADRFSAMEMRELDRWRDELLKRARVKRTPESEFRPVPVPRKSRDRS